MVDGATSEPISIVSRVPQGIVLGPLLFIYTSKMFELAENTLYADADDSTQLSVVCKPEDRTAVAASTHRDLARIQEWCNHWCMILNPNKIKALVVSGSRTLNSPNGDMVLSGVYIHAPPNLDILGVKFYSKLTFESIVSCISQSICILRLVKHVLVDTTVLLHCYYAFVLPIPEYCSLMCGSTAECHLQLLEHQVHSMARSCPAQSFLSSCHRHHDAGLYIYCTRLLRTLITVCSLSFLLLEPELNIPELWLQLINWS